MKKIITYLAFLVLAFTFYTCSSDSEEVFEDISPVKLSPDNTPWPKLSDYQFFNGDIKNLEPAFGVLPYKPASELFTDYALKKRFVWMPKGSKATYNGDGKILNFPDKTILIKNFYYNNVLPENNTKILETRLLIKINGNWIFAEYIWNEEQTDAFLNMDGGNINLSWMQNGETKSTYYRFPNSIECRVCHINQDKNLPIGPKPQNLNYNFTYSDGSKNQLQKWIDFGYLESIPSNINSVVDYKDTSKPIDLRFRSYLDINCAHCHQDGGDCSYRALRFEFNQTSDPTKMGVCQDPEEEIPAHTKIIFPGRIERSVLYYRISTDEQNLMMPKIGRFIVHEEALQLTEQYIQSLSNCN